MAPEWVGAAGRASQRSYLSGTSLAGLLAVTLGVLPVQAEEPTVPDPCAGHRGILETDPASGAVTLHIPLGPGVGGSGVRYVPALVGRFAPQVVGVARPGGHGPAGMPNLLPATGFDLSPGTLDLPMVPWAEIGTGPGPRWTYPDGNGGRAAGTAPPDLEGRGLLQRFGYESTLGSRAPEDPVPLLLRGAGGEYLISLAGRTQFPGCTRPVPSGFVVVRENQAYEYEIQAVRPAAPGAFPGWVHYRLAAIRSDTGAAISFTYGPNGVDFAAAWGAERVGVRLQDVRAMAPVPALDAPAARSEGEPSAAYRDSEQLLRVAYEGPGNVPGYTVSAAVRLDPDGSPAGGGRTGADILRRPLQVTLIQGDVPGERIVFSYGRADELLMPGTDGDLPFAPTVLNGIDLPGRSLELAWQGLPWDGSGESKEGWSYGVMAVDETTAGSGWPARLLPLRQVRHFAFTGEPCQTFVRDRYELGGADVPEPKWLPEAMPRYLPYRYDQDIPTFVLDPQDRVLVPIAGRLTRWCNEIDPLGIHIPPGRIQGRLLGGDPKVGTSEGSASRGSREGPTSDRSMAAIRSFDRAHSRPGVSKAGGRDSFERMREVNNQQRKEALDHATRVYLGGVVSAAGTGVARGVARGLPGGPAAAAGGGITTGVAQMGITAVVGGIALEKERARIEKRYQEMEREINNAEKSGNRPGRQGQSRPKGGKD